MNIVRSTRKGCGSNGLEQEERDLFSVPRSKSRLVPGESLWIWRMLLCSPGATPSCLLVTSVSGERSSGPCV